MVRGATVYKYACAYVCMCECMCKRICLCEWLCTGVGVGVRSGEYDDMYLCIHVRKRAIHTRQLPMCGFVVHARTESYMHLHTSIRINTHTHIHGNTYITLTVSNGSDVAAAVTSATTEPVSTSPGKPRCLCSCTYTCIHQRMNEGSPLIHERLIE